MIGGPQLPSLEREKQRMHASKQASKQARKLSFAGLKIYGVNGFSDEYDISASWEQLWMELRVFGATPYKGFFPSLWEAGFGRSSNTYCGLFLDEIA